MLNIPHHTHGKIIIIFLKITIYTSFNIIFPQMKIYYSVGIATEY